MGKCYVWVVKPTAIWSASVNGSPDQGARSITYDGASLVGGWTVDVHFTLRVENQAQTVTRGYIRYKAGASGAATGTLTVDKNNLEWVDDDVLTIYAEVRPWAITPNIPNTQEDEDKVYVDENEDMHPLTLLGPPSLVFLDGANVDTEWWATAELSHVGGSISSTSWTYKNGVKQSGSGTEIDPDIIRYTTAGNHFVVCEKTHSNGKSHKRYSYTIVADRTGANAPYTDVEVRASGDLNGHGGRATVVVKEGGSQNDFVDNAMVVIAAETWHSGVQAEYGGNWTFRENVKFVGWIETDSVSIEPLTGEVSFEVVHPAMMKFACWPANLADDNALSPGWHRILGMRAEQAYFHLISEHSTLDHCCDIHLPTTTLDLLYADISEASLWTQLQDQIGVVMGAVMAFDRQAAFYIEADVQKLPLASRSGVDTMFTMAASDWQALDLDKERGKESVAQVDFAAFYYSGTDPRPWFSLAPARQYPYGSISRTRGVRADSQGDANELAGLYLAAENAEFQDNRAQMAGQWFCFDAMPQKYFILTLTGTEDWNYRGLVWSGQAAKMLVRGYDLSYNQSGYWEAQARFAQDALGPAGDTGNYPEEVDPADPPTPTPSPIPIPAEPPGWPGKVFVAGMLKGVYYSANFTGPDGSMPTWTAVNDNLPSLDVIYFGINAGLTGEKQQVCLLDSNRNVYTRDTDVDDNWYSSLSEATVQGDLDASAVIESMGVDITTGRIWVYVYVSGITDKHYVYYSDDWGSAWSGPNKMDHSTERDDTLRATGMITGKSALCWASNCTWQLRPALWYGPSNGVGPWILSDLTWATVYAIPMFLHPAGDGSKAYTNETGEYISEWAYTDGDTTSVTVLETDGLWDHGAAEEDQRWNSMWGSWTYPNTMRCYTRFGGTGYQRIAETTDNWSTYSFGARFDYDAGSRPWGLYGLITHLAPVVQTGDEDMIIMGTGDLGILFAEMSEAIWVMDGINDQPVARAGSMTDSAPFTNSIPYDIGELARNGIQVVRGS
jgi:hypothetical protein